MRDDDAVADLMACQPQILVNNAGGGAVLRPCFPEASVERWSASLELNLRAPMLTTQLALVRDAGGRRRRGRERRIDRGAGVRAARVPRVQRGQGRADPADRDAGAVAVESHGVRVNCVVPDWVATERGVRRARAALPEAERGPELVPLEVLTDAVVRFVEDETLAGRVVLLDRDAEPRFLDVTPVLGKVWSEFRISSW